MMKGILQQENVLEDKNRGSTNYNRLVQKMPAKAKNEYAHKKERHVMRKKYMESKVQPGAHQDLIKHTDFKPVKKQDFLQFFGTTDNKIDDKNFVNSKNPNLGPGSYDAYAGSFQPKQARRAYTASFATNRKDMLFSGNSNPGPQEYSTNESTFHSKNW
jgi:hypothetical protein